MSPVDARAARHGHPAPSRDGHAAAPQHGDPGTSGDGGHPSEARDGGQASACRVGGHPAPPQDEYHASPVAGHRIGLERVAELMAVAGAATFR